MLSTSVMCPVCSARIAEATLERIGESIAIAQVCSTCSKPFELYVIERPYQPVAPQATTASGSLAGSCAYHPNNQAAACCARCGDFVCNLCLTSIEGQGYCPKCFELMYARGSLDSSKRSFGTPSMSLGLGLCSFFLGWVQCLGFVLAPLAIYFGLRALKEIDRRPELPGRSKAIAGIIFGAVGVLMTILVYVGIIGLAFWQGAKGGDNPFK